MDMHFTLFIGMVMSLIIVPGPDMLYVVGRSVARGGMAGFCSAFGVAVGYAVFTALVAVGVGATFEAHPGIFGGIRLAGMAYLSYLAYRLLRATGEVELINDVSSPSHGEDFLFGVLTSTLNPKGVLFYFSILPQFYVSTAGPFWRYAMVYGLTTSALCLVLYFIAGLGAIYGAGQVFVTRTSRRRLFRFGGLILSLAVVAMAWSIWFPNFIK